MPGHEVFTGMIFEVIHFTANRIAVHVHVKRRHKNGYLYALITEKLSFFNLFNHHYLAIGRCNNMLLVNGSIAVRIAEKLQHNDVDAQ